MAQEKDPREIVATLRRSIEASQRAGAPRARSRRSRPVDLRRRGAGSADSATSRPRCFRRTSGARPAAGQPRRSKDTHQGGRSRCGSAHDQRCSYALGIGDPAPDPCLSRTKIRSPSVAISGRPWSAHRRRSGRHHGNRRAGLASGPDVREAVRAVKSARSTEPELADGRLLGLIADNTGTPLRLIRTAARYRASCPEGIDGQPGHHPTRLSSTGKDARIAAVRRGRHGR
jgi:hypothetical protein